MSACQRPARPSGRLLGVPGLLLPRACPFPPQLCGAHLAPGNQSAQELGSPGDPHLARDRGTPDPRLGAAAGSAEPDSSRSHTGPLLTPPHTHWVLLVTNPAEDLLPGPA